MKKALLAAVALALWVRGDFTASAWRLRRPISGTGPALVEVPLDRAVYVGARADMADLRVIHGGREVPYVIQVRDSSASEIARPVEIIDRGATPVGVQLTLSIGRGVRHNRVELQTPLYNFRQNVLIETSDDRVTWALVRKDASIFDFTGDDRSVSASDIGYPDSTRAFVRVTVLGWHDPRAVSGAKVTCFERTPSVRTLMTEAIPSTRQDGRRTLATFDLGAAGVPVNRLETAIDGASFHRRVEIESSADGAQWHWAAWGSLERYGGGENLALQVPERRERYLRLIVYNGDDPPLSIRSAKFYALERVLKFEFDVPEFWLYYGYPEARAPEYDLARRMPKVESVQASLAPEQPNPDYVPPTAPSKPWTDRHPALLWTAMILAMLLIGGGVFRLMRNMARA